MSIPFGSTVLGIIDFLIEWAIGFVASTVNFIVTMISALLSRVLYAIGTQLMGFVDFVQTLFRKMVGLDSYWYNGVLQESTIGENPTQFLGTFAEDPLLNILSEKAILEVLLAIAIIAFALLIMATFIQIIRVQYTQEGAKNTVGNIVGQTLKALAMFLIVPISCFLGIFVSNQILAAVDAATNNSGNSSITGAIFVASASGANRMRISIDTMDDDNVFVSFMDDINGIHITVSEGNIVETDANNNGQFTSTKTTATARAEEIAQIIDSAFALRTENNNPMLSLYGKIFLMDWANVPELLGTLVTLSNEELNESFSENVVATYYNFMNPTMVQAYYDLTQIDYLVMFISCGLVIWSLYLSVFGLIMRVYKTILLFVVSPAAVAIMPIDGGNAFKSWRTSFLEAVLGAYGVIVTLNLFIIILPLLKNIQLFDPTAYHNYYYNNFVYLLFVVVGCYMFKKLSGMISKLFGGEDIMESGGEMAGKAMSMAASISPVGGALAAGRGIAGLANRSAAKRDRAQRDDKVAEADKAFKEGRYEDAEKLNKEASALNASANKHSESSGKYMAKFNSNAGVSKVISGYNGTIGAMGLTDAYGATVGNMQKHSSDKKEKIENASVDKLNKNTKEIKDYKERQEAEKQALFDKTIQNPDAIRSAANDKKANIQNQMANLNNFNSKDMNEILNAGDMGFATTYAKELKDASGADELQSDKTSENERNRDLLAMIDTDLKKLQGIMDKQAQGKATATDLKDMTALKANIANNMDEVVKNGNSYGAANMDKQDAVINYTNKPNINITNQEKDKIIAGLDTNTKSELDSTVKKSIKEELSKKQSNEELKAGITKGINEKIGAQLSKMAKDIESAKKDAATAAAQAAKAAKKK